MVRRAKRKVEGFSDPENIRKAKAELKAAQKKLRDFIDQTNAAEGKEILKRDYGREKIYGAPSPPVQSAPAPPVDVPDTPKVTPAEITLDAPQAPPDAYRDTPVPEREGLIMGSGDVHEIKSSADIQFDRVDGSKPIAEELAEEYRKEYDNFVGIFGELPNLRAINISLYKGDGTWGEYYDQSREIILYGVGGKNGKKNIADISQKMKGSGEWSTSSPYHTLRHELGHTYQQLLEMNDKNWVKKLTLISTFRQQLAISLTNQPQGGKIKTEKDILSKYGMLKTDEFISESIAEYVDKKDKSRSAAKKTIKILAMGEDNMLMSLPDEMYEYVDITGKEPVVMANAPEYIKKKAEEINAKSIKATGKPFFAEIK